MIKKIMSEASGLVKAAFFSGLALAAVFGSGLAVLNATLETSSGASVREQINFQRLLGDYDLRRAQIFGPWETADAAEAESLGLDLDRMEAKIESEGNWLSVLKRRRRLATLPGADPGRIQAYRRSSAKALRDFPFSQPIAAVAASALALGSVGAETEEELRGILPRLTGTGFIPIRIALHALLGDFQSPERASRNLLEEGGMSLDFAISAMGYDDTEAILTSLVILRALEGETRESLFAVQNAAARDGASDDFIRFAAEFVYDFGNPVRSAELFHMLSGEDALSRQADAFWLAGYTELARLTWSGLVTPSDDFNRNEAAWEDVAALEDRALYNLAVTAETDAETDQLLTRLALQGDPGRPYRDLGVILFTRLLDPRDAIAALETEKKIRGTDSGALNSGLGGRLPKNALIDLEILKRRVEMGDGPRIVAETWMLVNRNHDLEDIYEWAAWLFTMQRNMPETERLILTAERQGFSGSWMGTHRALQLIHDGRLETAVGTMETAQRNGLGDWALSANLGRVLEARGAASRALEHYQRALTLLMETGAANRHETASVLHFRIARCLRTVGRTEESRRELMEAVELNPNNLQARLDLSRM